MTSPTARSARRTRLTVRLSGIVTQFRGLPEDLYARLRDLLAPFEDATAAPPVAKFTISRQIEPPLWLVDGAGESRRGFRYETDLLTYLEWLAVAQATQTTTQHVIFHAGAVTREAKTILLVAESGAGKTTLTLGLLQRGWLPLSDDTALVSPETFAVAPFPRCFHVDTFTRSAITQPSLVEDVGALDGYLRPVRWAEAPAQVSCVVRLERDPTAPTSIQQISQAEAAGAVLQSVISSGLPRGEAARVAAGVAAGASCWRVNNGALDATLDTLDRLAAGADEV
jgi:tRNA A37 threonylcarbamoyladenosine biosynthesis protein TsaE